MSLKTHKDLNVWKESIKLVKDVYKLTGSFPTEEKYNLTSQLRRSAISVPSNIAEGSARDSNKEYIHFLYIALGSLTELDTQLYIAVELRFLEQQEYLKLENALNEIGKMLSGLIKHRKSLL